MIDVCHGCNLIWLDDLEEEKIRCITQLETVDPNTLSFGLQQYRFGTSSLTFLFEDTFYDFASQTMIFEELFDPPLRMPLAYKKLTLQHPEVIGIWMLVDGRFVGEIYGQPAHRLSPKAMSTTIPQSYQKRPEILHSFYCSSMALTPEVRYRQSPKEQYARVLKGLWLKRVKEAGYTISSGTSINKNNVRLNKEFGAQYHKTLHFNSYAQNFYTIDLESYAYHNKEHQFYVIPSHEQKIFETESTWEEDLEGVLIRSGSFRMGALENDLSADPDETEREVSITYGFEICRYPVTQRVWGNIMKNNPSFHIGPQHPVTNINWFDCICFCNMLSQKLGLERVYSIDKKNIICDFSKNGFRLLRESEWEYAARQCTTDDHIEMQTTYQRFSGSDQYDDVAWVLENTAIQQVESKKANGIGLFDMSGNVLEWCWDESTQDKNMYTTENEIDDYQHIQISAQSCVYSGHSDTQVVRGGSAYTSYEISRVSNRLHYAPETKIFHLGFRIGRTRSSS